MFAFLSFLPVHSIQNLSHTIVNHSLSDRNLGQAVLAFDFCVVVTATFRVLCDFITHEHASRRVIKLSSHKIRVTAHTTAEWTFQQLREAISSEHVYRFLIHDRHGVFSEVLDNLAQRTA
jgi:hypothetical protein